MGVGRGVTFWQLPDEEDAFFRFLMKRDSVYAFPLMEAVADPSLIRAEPIEHFLGRKAVNRLYITPFEYASRPKIFAFQRTSLGEPVRYTLAGEFPSIMYSPGVLKDGQLSQSNASAYTCYVDGEPKVIHKMPADYLRWLNRVMGWLRRATPEWDNYPGYRATKAAAQAAISGLALVPYHGWSGPHTGNSSFMPGCKKAAGA